ncbi:MAG: M20/M25/M40 family metallo-hydrolase [Gemmatimonadetes bacterium]|nr:M20/M25/M40 family metallo-hydrolase [Gemmatimonadota bacterium]
MPARPSFIGSLLALTATAALGAPTGAAAQSTERLMADVGVLAADSMAGRAAGSEGARWARDYIVGRLDGLGLDVHADTFAVTRGETEVEAVNLRVAFPGSTHPDRHIVVSAHYDHVGVRGGAIYNGADDNASGAAALLALAEALSDDGPEHAATLVFTDAEEGGLHGARHFVAEPPMPLERIVVNLNFDMVSRSDRDLWVSGTYPWPELRPVFDAFEATGPVVLRAGHDTPEDRGADNWIMASDHAPFHQAGIPFLYFGVADHPDYHQPTDDTDAIDPVFFGAALTTLIGAFRTVDAQLEGGRPDAGRPAVGRR